MKLFRIDQIQISRATGLLSPPPWRWFPTTTPDAKDKHHAMLERPAKSKSVRLVQEDPVRGAVRHVMGYLASKQAERKQNQE